MKLNEPGPDPQISSNLKIWLLFAYNSFFRRNSYIALTFSRKKKKFYSLNKQFLSLVYYFITYYE